ncbi:MAG: DUF1996 domain-containing protein [Acidimicrobiales bacterium]|nr:DUF1996 domain-containing protein [Acidimicrobiales bacterium]
MTGVLAVVLTAVIAGVAATSRAPVDLAAWNALAEAAAPSALAGPQGRTPQFVVKCGFSHAAGDDPIVHPGRPGASHRHDFFGNTDVDADATYAWLQGAETTCQRKRDTASYWAPSLLDRGVPVEPREAVAYYRPAPGVAAREVEAFPAGLQMIGGDDAATEAQPAGVAGWACGASSDLYPTPPICTPSAPLQARIVFPDCWTGDAAYSSDHRSHVARSLDGTCPPGHPVHLPQLVLVVKYPVWGAGHELSLSSGPVESVHADFWNTWHQEALETDVRSCLHREVVCGVVDNKADDVPAELFD